MKKSISFLIIWLFTFGAKAQQNLVKTEMLLAEYGMKTVSLKTEEQRLAAADTFAEIIDTTIGAKTAFDYPFDAVKNLSKLRAPKGAFRIYTWSVPLRDGSFQYFGRICIPQENGFKILDLKDSANSIVSPEYQLLTADRWYGTLYYDILHTKNKGTDYYTLIGYRPNRQTHNEKVLEVISSDQLKRFRFGSRIFNTPKINGIKYKSRPYRLIFRYNPKTVVSVKKVKDFILMDHLSPDDLNEKDEWSHYGPDFSYQALIWEKGKWQLEDNYQVKTDIKPATPQPTEKGLPKK